VYTPIAIEPLAGQALTRAYGVNNAGRVVGRSYNWDPVNQKAVDRTAFVWDPAGGTRPLPTLGGESGAWGLNAAGQASGFSYTAAGLQHAVRWSTTPGAPTVTDLGTLANATTGEPGPTSTAYDLNDQGDVTGYSEIPNDAGDFTPFHAILSTDADGLQDLGTFDTLYPYYQYGYSISYSANGGGEVVGLANDSSWRFRPFVGSAPRALRELPTDAAYPTQEWYAVAINDGGVIGGHVIAAPGQSRPYSWASEAAPPAPLPLPAAYPYGEVYGIDAEGVMVGIMWNDAQEEHAFVFDPIGGLQDLNALVDPALGWTLQFARDINDSGQVAGSGTLNGVARGFLLSPAVSLSVGDVSLKEGNRGTRNARFAVTLSAPIPARVTLAFATADGTAAGGVDYVAKTGTLTFTPGVTLRFVDVTVNGDAAVEPSETFFLELSSPTNATVADGQGLCTIANDDPPRRAVQ
jgi:uncharacterized membrane protein